jgi:DNA-binding transcriptional ArsR family regulator
VDIDELRALAHPLRLRMLSLLTGESLSAAEVARALDVTQANASYHLRLLERAGLVRVVEEVRIRGGVARRYRHESSAEPFDLDAPQPHVDPAARAAYLEVLAAAMRDRAAERVDGPAVNTDADLHVDPEVWRRVVEMVGDASRLLHASARPAGADTIRVSMTAALFVTAQR